VTIGRGKLLGVGSRGSVSALAALTLLSLWCATATAKPAFPLRVSDNRRYFVDQASRPFFIQGDASWSLITGLTPAEAEEYLTARKRQGFNTVLVNLLDDSHSTLRDGTAPFGGNMGFRDRTERYFAHAEAVLEMARRHDFLVLLVPVYLGCCEAGWKDRVAASTPSDLSEYGYYLGSRFRRFPNLWWVLGGDRDPDTGFGSRADGLRLHIRALAEGIQAGWPDAVLTAHTASGTSARLQYNEETWLDVNNIYTYYPEENLQPHVYVWAYREYAHDPPAPFFLIESAYEDDGRQDQNGLTIRRQAFWSLVGGACGHIYGHGSTWKAAAGWREGLRAPGAWDLQRFSGLIAGLPWYRLEPDLRGQIIAGDQAAFGSEEWIGAARSTDNRLAVAYVPHAVERLSARQRVRALLQRDFASAWSGTRQRTIRVSASVLPGKVVAFWYIPSTGQTEPAPDVDQGPGISLTPPCRGDVQACDAFLLLTTR
jgi:hypothetical protein